MTFPVNVETSQQYSSRHVAALGSHEPGHNLSGSKSLPAGVLAVGLAGYVGILGAFWIAFGSETETAFILFIVTLFGLMYFGLPLLMHRTAIPYSTNKPRSQSISNFLMGDFDTFTGRIS